MINNTEALILNSHYYGDTSLICNLFTKQYGRISVISKGARSIKNPNRSILQPLQYINLHYYFKPQRNIQLLKEASIDSHFYKTQNNYKKLMYSYHIIDILNQICQTNNPNDIIFRLSKTVLKKINNCIENEISIYYLFFLLQLLKYLGYQPILDFCSECNQQFKQAQYNFVLGQLVCNICSNPTNHDTISLDKSTLNLISKLSNTHIDKLTEKLTVSNTISFNKIKKYLLYYISFHIINIQKFKTLQLVK